MRVLDFTIINDEMDMLEIRLKYLSPVVDYFIIVESNKTFSGRDKEYNLEKNWDRFKPFHNKIHYIQIEQDYPQYEYKQVDQYTPDNAPWQMEYEMRNALAYGKEFVKPDSLCLIGDIDELPDINLIREYKDKNFVGEISIIMNFHGFFLNMKNTFGPDCKWGGTKIVKGNHFLQANPQHIRDRRNITPYIVSENSFHFSWMNGVEAIKNKIQSFAHTEFNKPEIVDDQSILSAIERGEDVLHRPGVKYEVVPMSIFPEELRTVLEQYPHLIK